MSRPRVKAISWKSQAKLPRQVLDRAGRVLYNAVVVAPDGRLSRSLIISGGRLAQVAQLVEQRIENPRVGGSIPPLGTITPPQS